MENGPGLKMYLLFPMSGDIPASYVSLPEGKGLYPMVLFRGISLFWNDPHFQYMVTRQANPEKGFLTGVCLSFDP